MTNIGIIGLGNMGSAITRGILNADYAQQADLFVYDTAASRMEELAEEYPNLNFCKDAAEVAEEADLILLAVKPNMLAAVVDGLRDSLEGKAIISIAAGWTCAMLRQLLDGIDTRFLRVMPNTPAMVGEGMTALCTDNTLTPDELNTARGIFSAIGRTTELPEAQFDGVVALSGSGPAYVYMLIETMADGGVREGLKRHEAIEMAAQTVLGSALMVLTSDTHPAQLKDAVCSPAGTTIDAVAALEEGGFRSAVLRAMRACADKSREMGKQ